LLPDARVGMGAKRRQRRLPFELVELVGACLAAHGCDLSALLDAFGVVRHAQAGALAQAPVAGAWLATRVSSARVTAGWLPCRHHASSLFLVEWSAHGRARTSRYDSRRDTVQAD